MNNKNFHIPIIFLSILVAFFSGFGRLDGVIEFLTFLKPASLSGGYYNFLTFEDTFIKANEWWRLITPMFIHFSLSHLAFNCLWLYVLGSRIELHDGKIIFITLIIFSSITANYFQYIFSGPSLFGGLSGVVYGMFGFCMVLELELKNLRYGLPPAIYLFMLIWMLLGFLGVLEIFGFGNIANFAHLGGLISGLVFGMVSRYISVLKLNK